MFFTNKNEETNRELTKTIELVMRLEAKYSSLEAKLDAQTQKLNSLRALVNRKLGYGNEHEEEHEEKDDSPISGMKWR